jgi:UDP-N-acetylmuramoyl-L-alanyl-D-glutamate--2,6-diaminopimelate ligase
VKPLCEAPAIELPAVLCEQSGVPDVRVVDLKLDSRDITPGDAFVALPGFRENGLSYVDDAVRRGAKAILCEANSEVSRAPSAAQVPLVPVVNLRERLGLIANRAYGDPSAGLDIVGVTGTNGKTTCAWIYAHGRDSNAMYIGTLGAGRCDALRATRHTTQDVLSLIRTLAGFRRRGVRHVALEVSSHALDQNRIDGVKIPVAAFTNLTRDHLDYHVTMEAYGEAKAKLFSHPGTQTAVVNVDDEFGRELAVRVGTRLDVIRVSAKGVESAGGRWLAARDIRCGLDGVRIAVTSHLGQFELSSRLIGKFNVENLLVVLGMLLASDVSMPNALEILREVDAPPGRMEVFHPKNGPLLVVDYAHTPDALAKVLAAIREHTSGEIWCVFGCGGDRDPGKRPLMAAAAEAGADRVIVTDDNPRTEDGDRIAAMVFGGFSGRVPVEVDRDREHAIASAYRRARPGDVVLVAGKGHENQQIYGIESRSFSDRDVARNLVRAAA